ncbi:hypothetical protein L9F63_019765 [Diploptera punctata]|uniref:Major facilitator superfamily (MFS) profile domain-containing protein n=1 Tax=Diploptera punctata TaxID=6984 RepID=A0AAD8EDT8_DIPPU|nr:hypothetical protein L9F63_019765 [Diploptera punctata]
MNTNAMQPSRAFLPQMWVFCGDIFVGTSYGMSLGHSAVLLPLLQANNSGIVIDEDMGSWIASVYAMAAPLGCILCGVAMDFWGRKKLNIIGSVGMILGWLLITVAQNALMVVFGRVLEGFSRSVLATAITVLSDELASPKYRGFIACGLFTSVSAGILIISVLGAFLDWRTASGLPALVSFSTLLLFYFIPESPVWYVKKNTKFEAEKVLRWLWGPGNEIQVREELKQLSTRLQPHQHTNFKQNIKRCLQGHIMKPFLIIHTYNILQIFCGLGLFTYYTIDFVSKIRKSYQILDDYLTTILISVIRLAVTIASSLLMVKFGRRTISMISSACSSMSALALSLLLYLQSSNSVTQMAEAYASFILVMLYVGSVFFGLFMLPSLMIGETQAPHVRGLTCGYIYTMNDVVLGGIVKLYPWLSDNLKMEGLFLVFGISCVVCTVFVYLFLPETQGLTLQQIEDYFHQPNVLWTTRRCYQQVGQQTQDNTCV